jgi:hypothetical protein
MTLRARLSCSLAVIWCVLIRRRYHYHDRFGYRQPACSRFTALMPTRTWSEEGTPAQPGDRLFCRLSRSLIGMEACATGIGTTCSHVVKARGRRRRQRPIALETVEKQLERPMPELKLSQMNARVSEAEDFFCVFPDQSIFGLRSSCDRAELMLALVIRLAPT